MHHVLQSDTVSPCDAVSSEKKGITVNSPIFSPEIKDLTINDSNINNE